MQMLIQKILPPDPPLTPMTFTRLPVVHLFWAGGLFAALLGFGVGFLLWSWQQGILPMGEFYPLLKLWHARIQIILFLGSFLLGFALQSGPHVVGGPPPPSRPLLRLLILLWVGFFLSLIFHGWLLDLGNMMVSIAYLGAVYYLARIAQKGDPSRRLSRGIPLALSFIPLAIAPWLALDNAEQALWVLWCGPITSALVAGQQLINNVLGGKLLQGRIATLFAVTLLTAWILSTLAAFSTVAAWHWAGLAWVAVLIVFILGTHFLRAAWRFGFAAIQVTLVGGFASALLSAGWLAMPENPLTAEAALHLLGVGMLTTLILGVVARVVSFFVGSMAFNDRMLCYLLFVWNTVAFARLATALGWHIPNTGLIALMLAGSLIILVWIFRIAARLWQIQQNIPPALK